MNNDQNSPETNKSWGYEMSAVFLGIIGMIIIFFGYVNSAWGILALGILSVLIAFVFTYMPSIINQNSKLDQIIDNQNDPNSAEDNKTQQMLIAKLEKTISEHEKRIELQHSELEKFKLEEAKMVDSVQTAMGTLSKNEKYEQQIESLRSNETELNDIIKRWVNRSIDFIDYLDRTLSFSDIDETYRQATIKTRVEYVRNLRSLGLDEIAPKPGDSFDERYHKSVGEQAIKAEDSTDIESGRVGAIDQVGFQRGREVIRPASVWVVS